MRLITAAFACDLFLLVSAAAILAERDDAATFTKKSTKVSACRQKFFAIEEFHGTKEPATVLGLEEQAELANEEVAGDDRVPVSRRDGEAKSGRVKREEDGSGEGEKREEDETREMSDMLEGNEEEGDAEEDGEGNEAGGVEMARGSEDYDERVKKTGEEGGVGVEEIGEIGGEEDDEGSTEEYSGEVKEKENGDDEKDGDEDEQEEEEGAVENGDGKRGDEEFSKVEEERVTEAVERTAVTTVNNSGDGEPRGEKTDVEKSRAVEMEDGKEFLEELGSRLIMGLRAINFGEWIRKMVKCITSRGKTSVEAIRRIEEHVTKKLTSDDFRAKVARLLHGGSS